MKRHGQKINRSENRMNIDERIYQVLKRTFSIPLSWENWGDTESFLEWTSLDSMAVLEFLAALEQEFHFRFPAQDLSLDLLTSRSRLVRYLTERVNEG